MSNRKKSSSGKNKANQTQNGVAINSANTTDKTDANEKQPIINKSETDSANKASIKSTAKSDSNAIDKTIGKTAPKIDINLFKPTIVLTCVTTIVALLLIVTHQITYVDTSNIITDKLKAALTEVMGEGEYEIVSDWSEYGAEKPDNVEKLIKKSDGGLAFEIITDGYSKKGIDLLVGINKDGSVKGISVVSLGETPGLGTKVENESFLSQFTGKKGQLAVVKNAPSKEAEVQGVTGATYSSKGVTKAVNIAIEAYGKLQLDKEEVK